jgi:histidine phosphotransferase ChpT
MGVMVEMRVLELLNARFCHELVSVIGAINNGIELLGEDDPDFVRDAIQLIGQSGRKASQRLQFYRFAYGTPIGTAGGAVLAAGELALGLLEGGKVQCEWAAELGDLSPDWQRLACNVLVLAAESLPRGGSVIMRPLSGGVSGIEAMAEGQGANVNPETLSALDQTTAIDGLTSRTIQAYFAARLASTLGATLELAEASPNRVLLRAASR